MIKAGEVKDINSVEVTFKGVFDLQNLYNLMNDWLKENDFHAMDTKNETYRETYYLKKTTPGYGDELDIWWRMKRTKSPIFHHAMNIDFHTLGISDTEIVYEGKKFKTNKGEIKIKINSKLEIDPKKEFSKKLPGFLNNFFFNRLYQKEYKENKDKLFNDTYKFHQLIKQYLEVKGFTGEQEMFKPSKGTW